MTSIKDFHTIAKSVANVCQEKNKAYGDSFKKAGAVMRILYPDGVSIIQLDDALVVVRVIDKLFRIATSRDSFGESPWRDICGYSLLAIEKLEQEPEQENGNGNF